MDQIKQLPKTPTLPPDVSDGGKSLVRALWDHIINSNETVNKLIKQLIGLKPEDIGALPATTTPEDIGAATALHNHDSLYAAKTQEAWQVPVLLNGWVNYASTHVPVGYYKDSLGIVHLRGLVKSGTPGTVLFVLPVGYRLSYIQDIVTISAETLAHLQIGTNGNVLFTGGSNIWVSLNNISFRPDS